MFWIWSVATCTARSLHASRLSSCTLFVFLRMWNVIRTCAFWMHFVTNGSKHFEGSSSVAVDESNHSKNQMADDGLLFCLGRSFMFCWIGHILYVNMLNSYKNKRTRRSQKTEKIRFFFSCFAFVSVVRVHRMLSDREHRKCVQNADRTNIRKKVDSSDCRNQLRHTIFVSFFIFLLLLLFPFASISQSFVDWTLSFCFSLYGLFFLFHFVVSFLHSFAAASRSLLLFNRMIAFVLIEPCVLSYKYWNE